MKGVTRCTSGVLMLWLIHAVQSTQNGAKTGACGGRLVSVNRSFHVIYSHVIYLTLQQGALVP